MSHARYPLRPSVLAITLLGVAHGAAAFAAAVLPMEAATIVWVALAASFAAWAAKEADKRAQQYAIEIDDAGAMLWREPGGVTVPITGGRVVARRWITLELARRGFAGKAVLLAPDSLDASAFAAIARAILHAGARRAPTVTAS